jgi:hypothetical protein
MKRTICVTAGILLMATCLQAAEKKKAAVTTDAVAYEWVRETVDDCEGDGDFKEQVNDPNPARGLCQAATVDRVAICWDGAFHKHNHTTLVGCAYKGATKTLINCKGGSSPGHLYTCRVGQR